MLSIDKTRDSAFDNKLRLKIEEKLKEIILKKHKALNASEVYVSVTIVDSGISLDISIGSGPETEQKITSKEHKSGKTDKEVYLDNIINPLLADLPRLTEECEREIR